MIPYDISRKAVRFMLVQVQGNDIRQIIFGGRVLTEIAMLQ